TTEMRALLTGLSSELLHSDECVEKHDSKVKMIAEHHPVCLVLLAIPGIGPMIATALVAAVGDPSVFKNGREMAAWLGLVPRQHSTGGKDRLLGISKRGDVYLRTLLIHGARAAIRVADKKEDWRSRWMLDVMARRGENIAVVALANKNVRIAWALLTKGEEYRSDKAA
ncbi:MAG: IS110 family transposase, partial [Magnetococcus sp. XQGC-1]